MAPSLPAALGLPSFDSTIGAVFLGLIVGTGLYGLTVYQAYKYYTIYTDDRPGLKLYITMILGLETFHIVLWIMAGYHYLITEAFSIVGLLDAHWTVRLTLLVTGFTVFISQLFYVHRVYHVGPRYYRWFAVPAALSMVAGLSFAIAAGIQAFTRIEIITDFKKVSWLVSIAYGFSVASDFILTGALVFVLHRSRTPGSKRSNTVLDILIKYTINTGLLTAICSATVFIFALILPGNLVYAGVSIVSAKLYVNSVLAVVNSRKSIGNKFLDDFSTYNVPARSRADIDCEESMVWNVHRVQSQPTITAGTVDTISTSPGVSYSASADTAVKPEVLPVNEKRPNFAMTV